MPWPWRLRNALDELKTPANYTFAAVPQAPFNCPLSAITIESGGGGHFALNDNVDNTSFSRWKTGATLLLIEGIQRRASTNLGHVDLRHNMAANAVFLDLHSATQRIADLGIATAAPWK